MEKENQQSFRVAQDCPEMNKKANLIVEAVAQVYHVDQNLILSNSREKNAVNARRVVMYLCRTRLDMSYKAIATFFHHSDSASVMVTLRKVDEQLKSDPYYYLKVNEVEFILNGISDL